MRSILCSPLRPLVIAIATLFPASFLQAQPPAFGVSFVSARAINSGQTSALSLAAVDLNADGRLDLVTGGAGAIWVEMNNGDGTFGNKVVAGGADSFAVADVDRDGFPDLITTGAGGTVNVAHGNGDGTFAAPVSYVITGSVVSYMPTVTVADLNGDGWPDIAVGIYGPAVTESVLFINQKNGKFVQGQSLAAATTEPYGIKIVAADLNGDHITDLAVVDHFLNNFTIFWGQGAGNFVKGPTYATGAAPWSLAVGDVNGDGHPDIAVSYIAGVQLFIGSSTGAFSPGSNIPESSSTSVVLEDLNGDGKVDLAFVVQATADSQGVSLGHISIYPGDGTGNFSAHKIYGVGAKPQILVAADLNGDGKLDLAVGDALAYQVGVLYNDGYGAFQGAPVDSDTHATGMLTYDFNHDGLPDIAAVNTPTCTAPCRGTVTVMSGTGQPYLGPPVIYKIGMHGAGIAVGDVNGDGIADLVVTNNTAGDNFDLSVLLGNADGTFQAARNQHLGTLSPDAILADVNGDHKPDLVTTAGVALGNGNGTFGAVIPYPDIANSVITHVAVADMNKDGFLDIVASTTSAPNVTGADAIVTFKGNGTGNFIYFATAYPQIAESLFIAAIVVGDLTQDGYPDVAICGITQVGNGYVAVLFNRKDGTVNRPADDNSNLYFFTAAPGGAPGAALVIGDLNGDGLPDLAMAGTGVTNGFYPDSVAVLLNNGAGGGDYVTTFNLGGSFQATGGPTPSIVMADFNHDGVPDLATSSQLGVSLLFSTGTFSFSPSSLSWVKVTIGQTGVPKTISVINTGKFSVALHAAVTGAEASEFRIYANTCNATIAAGASCSVTIAFRPTSTGSQQAALTITRPGEYNAILSTASLKGIGAP